MKAPSSTQHADGSFMRIEVISMLKLVFLSTIAIILLFISVLIGFGGSPDATSVDWTSRTRRCTTDFSDILRNACTSANQSAASNGSISDVEELLSLPDSNRTSILECAFSSCTNVTNRPFASTTRNLHAVHYSFGINGLQQRNRYFYLAAVFPNQKPNADGHTFQVTMTAHLKGLYVDEHSGNLTSADLTDQLKPQTWKIACYTGKTSCQPQYFMLHNDIYFTDYQVDVLFNSTASLPLGGSNVHFRKTWGTEAYTDWLIGLKLFFLFVSAFIALRFVKQINTLSLREQNIEQGWIGALAVALVLFNDPFFMVEASYASNPARILSVCFQVTFLQILLLYWLIAMDNMRLQGKEKGVSNMNFFRPKVVFVGFFWLMMLIYYGNIKYYGTNDTVWSPLDSDSNIALVRAICAILSIIYVIWYLYLLLGTLDELRARRVRYRYLVLLNLSMVLVFFIGFASDSFSPAPTSAGQWTAFIVIYNLYVYTMCYLYAPSSTVIKAAKKRAQEVGDQDPEASPALGQPVHPVAIEEPAAPVEPTPIDLPAVDVRDLELA